VFGREQSGLTNEELERCHALVHIPSNPEYSSLNLAQAVQVIAYEVYMAQQDGEWQGSPPESPPCSAAEMERFFAHLEQTVTELGFTIPRIRANCCVGCDGCFSVFIPTTMR